LSYSFEIIREPFDGNIREHLERLFLSNIREHFERLFL
jgi:hypothetical protein